METVKQLHCSMLMRYAEILPTIKLGLGHDKTKPLNQFRSHWIMFKKLSANKRFIGDGPRAYIIRSIMAYKYTLKDNHISCKEQYLTQNVFKYNIKYLNYTRNR